jgi:hypothetical protein
MIAISYRREDSLPVAGRLYDRLEQRFGKENVFMDFDSIQPGLDFRDQIKNTIERSKVVIAVIGPNWLGQKNDTTRRIDDPADFVRLEVAHALQRGIPVIPVLVNNTRMPKPETLPIDIQALAFRQALPLDSGQDFRQHAERLMKSVDDIAKKSPRRITFRRTDGKSRKRRFSARLLALAASAVVLLATIVVLWKERSTTQPAERGSKISQENTTPAQPSSFDKAPATISASERIPPRPKKYFNDYAGVISVDAVAQFNEQLATFERDTSNQVVVAVYSKKESTAPIDGYTRRVANAWGVGQADRQNGVLLFVFIEDRQMFMQVGEGLEDVLSNAKAFDITEHQIKAHFHTGDYEGGLKAGIDAICDATRNRYKGDRKTVGEKTKPTAQPK